MRSLLFLVAVVVVAYAAEDSLPQQPTYNNLLSINNDLYTSLTEQSPSPTSLQQQQSSILHHSYPTLSIHIAFTEWTSRFNKSYSTDITEHALRKVTWVQNHLRIISHNTLGQHSYTLGHNEYSDLSNNEFQQLLHLGKYSPGVVTAKGMSDGSVWGGGFITKSERRNLRSEDTDEFNAIKMGEGYEEIQLQQLEPNADEEPTITNVPEYKNWVEEGAVTSVKNQWFCGA